MSYIEMDSRELEEIVLSELSRIDAKRARIKQEALAKAKMSKWNRFWWRIFGTPSDDKLWDSFEGMTINTPHWKHHITGWDQREVGPKLLVAARHAKTVKVSANDIALFSRGKRQVSDSYRGKAVP